ncbi:MAG: zinc ribbon domain-containing protein [Planctomycetota bacterium]|jgi:putative FmdB family regulatory protein
MPIHDFDCSRCGHTFEELILGGETPECPECSSEDVSKRISSFSIGTPAHLRASVPMPGMPSSGFGAGSCDDGGGPGTCSSC